VFKPADNPGTFTRDPIARAWKAIPNAAIFVLARVGGFDHLFEIFI
jgi:hypothetical protein